MAIQEAEIQVMTGQRERGEPATDAPGRTCPYIGVLSDPQTALSFPSELNLCFRAGSPFKVNLEHQARHCVSPDYESCSLYLSGDPMTSVAVSSPSEPRPRRPVRKPLLALAVFFCLLAAAVGWRNQWGPVVTDLLAPTIVHGSLDQMGSGEAHGVLEKASDTAPATTRVEEETGPANQEQVTIDEPHAVIDYGQSDAAEGAGMDVAPTLDGPTGVTITDGLGAVAGCSHPPFWQTVKVQPGDTLERLAARHGVSVEEIINANCLSGTYLFSGELYLPPAVAEQADEAENASYAPPPLPAATETPAPPPPTPRPSVGLNG